MASNKIFVSYRRQDASGEAGRLVDDLQDVFGEESVFLDVETLEAGLDFVEAIDQALNSCKVMLAIIGPHWAKIKDTDGNLRLFEEGDFIRIEIAAALKRNIRVIPILVNGASMPSNSDLPEDLQPLKRRHAHEISSSRWKYDTEQLVEILSKIIEPSKKTAPDPPKQQITTPPPAMPKRHKSWFARNYLWLIAAAAVCIILIVVIGSEDFQQGFDEGYQEATTKQDSEIPNTAELQEDFTDQQNSIASTPEQTEPVQSDLLDVSGIWNLSLENELVSSLQMTQSGYQVEFAEYNLLNIQVGSGSGYWEDGVLYLDYYSSAVDVSGEFELEAANSGSLIGTLYIPLNDYTGSVRLTKNN